MLLAKINLNQEVPAHLAFSIILVLSFLVAWYSVTAAQKIIDSVPDSKAFNIEKRMDNKSNVKK